MNYKIVDQDNAVWRRLQSLDELQYDEWFTHNDINTLKKTLGTGVCAVVQGKLLKLILIEV